MRRLGLVKSLVLGAVAFAALLFISGADAAASCPVGDEACIAITERLDEIGAGIAALPQTDVENDYALILDTIATNTENVPNGSQEIAGTVALSESDRERFDLGWYGVWAIVGLLLVLMIAPRFTSALNVTRGM